MTEPSTLRASSSTAPEAMMPYHQDVRVHGVQRHRRVDQRSPLRMEEEETDMFITSAPKPLSGNSRYDDWCVWRPRRTG